jgi:hypothetical protein
VVTPLAAGLLMSDTVFGYHGDIDLGGSAGTAAVIGDFTSYLDSSGNFYLSGDGSGGSLAWDNSANTLAIEGAITVSNPEDFASPSGSSFLETFDATTLDSAKWNIIGNVAQTSFNTGVGFNDGSGSDTSWNSGFRSVQGLNRAYSPTLEWDVEVNSLTNNHYEMIGWAENNTNADHVTLAYAIYFNTGELHWRTHSSTQNSTQIDSAVTVGDVYRVRITLKSGGGAYGQVFKNGDFTTPYSTKDWTSGTETTLYIGGSFRDDSVPHLIHQGVAVNAPVPQSTIISGNSISTGKIQSTNWTDGGTAGSEINLDLGQFKLGGDTSPKLHFDGNDLSIDGKLTVTNPEQFREIYPNPNLNVPAFNDGKVEHPFTEEFPYDDLDTSGEANADGCYTFHTVFSSTNDYTTTANAIQTDFSTAVALQIRDHDKNGTSHKTYYDSLVVGDYITYYVSSDRWYTYTIAEIEDGDTDTINWRLVFRNENITLSGGETVISTSPGTDVYFRFQKAVDGGWSPLGIRNGYNAAGSATSTDGEKQSRVKLVANDGINVLELSSGDNEAATEIGAVWPAFAVDPNTTYSVEFTAKADLADSNGFYIRMQEHTGILTAGNDSVCHQSTYTNSPGVQTANNPTSAGGKQIGVYATDINGQPLDAENGPITTDWVTYYMTYTPHATTKMASLSILNWSTMAPTETKLYCKYASIRNNQLDATSISGDTITTGEIKSNNYSATAGSKIDLGAGNAIFGGSANQRIELDGTNSNLKFYDPAGVNVLTLDDNVDGFNAGLDIHNGVIHIENDIAMANTGDALFYVKSSNIGTAISDKLGAFVGVSDGTLDDAYYNFTAMANAVTSNTRCGGGVCYDGGTKIGLLTTAQATISTGNISNNNAFGIITTATTVDGDAYAYWGTGLLHNEGEISSTADVIAYASSDMRMKDNVVTISNPLDKIKQIRGVYFDWNDKGPRWTKEGSTLYPNGKKHDIGVIAQEVQKVLPEIVSERTKMAGEGMEGMLAVDYEKMVPLLIEGIKEQQTMIEDLQKQIDKLKGN